MQSDTAKLMVLESKGVSQTTLTGVDSSSDCPQSSCSEGFILETSELFRASHVPDCLFSSSYVLFLLIGGVDF